MTNGGKPNRWGRDLAVLTVLFGVLFGFMLGNRPLSVPDEGRYVEIPREMVSSGDYLTPRLDGVKYFEKPPLFYWFEAATIKLFGLSEWSVRTWPALFALFGCLAVYCAGSRLFGRRTGFFSAAVLATSPLYYALSRAIILDMAVSVLLSAALLLFLLGAREPAGAMRRSYFWGFYALAALATLTKGLIGILIPGMVIGAWMLVMNEWRTLRSVHLGTGVIIFLLIAAPWHILVNKANPEFLNFYFIHEHFQRYLTKVHGRYKPAWYFIPILATGLLPWSAFLLQAVRRALPSSWRERHRGSESIFLLLWAGLVFLFFSASCSKLIPYILPALPPLAILIGKYLAEAWDRNDMPGVRAGYHALIVVAVLLSAGLAIVPYYWPKPDDIQALGAWRTVFALTLAAGAVTTWGLVKYRGFKQAVIALAVTATLFLIEGNVAAPHVDRKSIKNLAVTLKARLKTGDEVASYQTYYQDLPVYLERLVSVVDWQGELEFGAEVEDSRRMIDGLTFRKRWQGPSTMYMVTRIETYDALRKDPLLKLFPIDRDSRNILVSNRKMKEANDETSPFDAARRTAERRGPADAEKRHVL